ncbi:serine carboxypeptidase S28 family protein [Tanacetum coccineum]
MVCSLLHTDYEVEALVQKLIDEDKVHQNAVLDLALQFENSCTAKDDLRKAYEKYEEALRETLEEQAMDEKAREEKIRQKQADDDEFFSVFEVVRIDSDYDENDPWEFGLDIDDSDLNLTPVLHSSSSTRVEPYPLTPNPVRIIPGPAGIVQLSSSTRVEPSLSTPNPVRIIPGLSVIEDVGEDDDFNSVAWDSATNYVKAFGGNVTGCLRDIDNFLKKEKLDQVVAIVKSCSPNVLGDLNVTMKDLSGTIPGTIHHKVIGGGGYGKDITVGAVIILSNVSVFTQKPSQHYLNITMKNVVEVFRKDSIYVNVMSPYSGKRSPVGRWREKADVAPESAGRDSVP